MHPPASFEKKKVTSLPREKILKALKTNASANKPVLERSLGVLPFQERGEKTGLGIAATEFLTANLIMAGKFRLINMSYTNLLEAELAYFSPEKKQKAIRAEQILTGFVTLSGEELFVHGLYRRPETENYKALMIMEGTGKDFFRLVADLGIEFLEENGITVTKSMADRFYTIPTENLRAYVLYAKGKQAEAMFDYETARAAYQQASKADPKFRQAKEGSDRVEQKIASVPEVSAETTPTTTTTSTTQTDDLFTNPVEQPPSVEERSIPPTSSTGTVTVEFELP
jgi:hypothetical protein